jgi:uncharacterized Zn finger protein
MNRQRCLECPRCSRPLHVSHHDARENAGAYLRCGSCGASFHSTDRFFDDQEDTVDAVVSEHDERFREAQRRGHWSTE